MDPSAPESAALKLPQEPSPSSFSFPPPATTDARGKVLEGGDLEPGTLLAAYRAGLFPMRQEDGQLAWWSPDPRSIIPSGQLHISKSLVRSCRRFVTRVDSAFEAVIDACADAHCGADNYVWITAEVRQAFVRLHQLGWAHSVETWTIATADEPSTLVGGLYGLAIGGLFSGESMFSCRRDASKVALVALEKLLRDDGRDGAGRLIDVQWPEPHMAALGAVDVRREQYMERLQQALALPLPPAFTALRAGSAPAR